MAWLFHGMVADRDCIVRKLVWVSDGRLKPGHHGVKSRYFRRLVLYGPPWSQGRCWLTPRRTAALLLDDLVGSQLAVALSLGFWLERFFSHRFPRMPQIRAAAFDAFAPIRYGPHGASRTSFGTLLSVCISVHLWSKTLAVSPASLPPRSEAPTPDIRHTNY
jgi:hypothetical protein